MNTPKTAPKDGSMFLADMGLPCLVACMWSESVNSWVYANPQVGLLGGKWNDCYSENEWDKKSELKAWIPMPAQSAINN
jgi:hypothetical protein